MVAWECCSWQSEVSFSLSLRSEDELGYSGVSERWRRRYCACHAAAAERSTSELLMLLFLRERGGRVRDVVEGATRRSVCIAWYARGRSRLVLGRLVLGRSMLGR